ncbi:MAG: hypothetical protein OS112_09750 [Methanoregula sp.]|nr:MAG: hypothetical protein OS112_09750 [Methanoregula sp.]
MIPEKEEMIRKEVFSQILLIGELFTPSGLEDEKKCCSDILQKCGITLNRSDFMILEHSCVGNSTVTIAKYNLDYQQGQDSTGKRICVEGTAAIQTDAFGTMYIRISSKLNPFAPGIGTTHSEGSVISGNI